MKTIASKVMVIMLSMMMTVSSFAPFSFAEDAGEHQTKAESTATVEEKKPEPPKAKAPEPEPVKEKAPEPKPEPKPEPVTEKKSEPANDNGSANGETPEEVVNDDTSSKEDQPAQTEESEGATEEVSVQIDEQTAQKEEPKEEKEEDEEKMPAQSFSGSAGGLSVSASAGKGVFPKNTKMKVSAVSASGVVAAAQNLSGADSEVVDAAAADITFYNGGKEIQPKGSVKISLRPTSAVEGDTFKMIHVSDGGSANVVSGASAGGGSASVSNFSIYGIIGIVYDEGTEVNARYTYNFYVEGKLIDSQTVINGETLTQPATPSVKEGKFEGWKVEGEDSLLNFSNPVSIPADADEDKTINVNAVFTETFYATFWKGDDKKQILATKEGKAGDTITTGDVTWKFPDGTGIVGWMLDGEQIDSFTIDKDVELLPIISKDVCTVTFETGEGSPIPTVFVEKGKTVTKPADPERSGYTFEGWFTDSACTKAFDFKKSVKEDLILHAKWEGALTSYKVVHWKQNANDDGYTFVEMSTVTGNAGANATYTANTYPGFTLNAAKTNINTVIKGDGTTIKNVYYDRKTYPLTFYVYEKTGTTGRGSNKRDVYEWVTKATKDFRYEADTSAYWNEISSKYTDIEWFKGETSNVSYSAAPVMEPPGGGNPNGFKGISVYGQKVQGISYVYYLDYADKKTKIRSDYVGGRVGWSFTDEDYIQIPGWTFKEAGKAGYEGYGYNVKYVGRLYYTRNNYGVKFIPGNGDATVEKKAAYEAPINNLVPSKYNSESTWNNNGRVKTFAGWYNNEALVGEPVDFSSMTMPALHSGGSLVFYGKWTEDQHSVSFDLDGGTFDGNNSIEAQTVESGKEATAPDSSLMAKTGFVFGGWVDEEGNRFSFDTKITEDYNLKAVWNSDKTKLLKVNYDVNGGSGLITDGNEYQDGAYAVIKGQPDAPEGKFFEGWKIGNSDLKLVNGSFQMNSADAENDVVTLTAQYADMPKYPTSVTYVLNGGNINGNTDSIVDKDAVVNGKYTVKTFEPVKYDCTFAGWSTKLEGEGSIFKGGDTIAAGKEGNILYARWKENPKTEVKLTITGNSDGNKVYDGTEQTVKGFTYTAVAAASDGGVIPDEAVTVTLKKGSEAKASGTDAGTYKMGLTANDFDIKLASGYKLAADPTVNDGVMIIAPYPIEVEITGETGTVWENDEEQSVSGFKAKAQGGGHPSTFDIKKVLWKKGETPVAKGTEPNTYPMGLNAKDFSYSDKNFAVTYNVSDGWLKITPKTKVKVIITGTSDGSKIYNGTKQSIEGFDYKVAPAAPDGPVTPIVRLFKALTKGSEDNLKDAVTVTLKDGSEAKASGINAGTYNMGLTPDDFEIKAAKGYKVVGDPDVNDGEMTISPYEITVEITGNKSTVEENGQEQSVSGFMAEATGEGHPSTFDIKKVLWKNGATPEAKGTEPNTYPMGLNAEDFSYADNNFTVAFEPIIDGQLTINPKGIIEKEEPKKEVLDEYEDDSKKKTAVLDEYDDGNDGKNSDKSTGGMETGDKDNLFLNIEILSLAVVSLIMMLNYRRRSEKECE